MYTHIVYLPTVMAVVMCPCVCLEGKLFPPLEFPSKTVSSGWLVVGVEIPRGGWQWGG